jgi:hypothetical protein
MPGTNERNERKSVVDDGWEPMKPERGPMTPLLLGFAVALVVVPLVAFFLTYQLMSR